MLNLRQLIVDYSSPVKIHNSCRSYDQKLRVLLLRQRAQAIVTLALDIVMFEIRMAAERYAERHADRSNSHTSRRRSNQKANSVRVRLLC